MWRVLLNGVGVLLLAGDQSATAANTPPRLSANQTVLATLAADTVITRTNLLTVDTETTDPVEIVYTISPDETGALFDGTNGLYRGSKLLQAKDTFTQDDIDAGRVFWRAPAVADEPGFGVPFSVRDFEGALASDGPYSVFTLRIEFNNVPPVALNGSSQVALDGTYNGVLAGTNAETFQNLSYRMVTKPLKGKVTMTDTNAGAFVYRVTPGQTGWDSFEFQVFDGKAEAEELGRFALLITNQPPVIPPQTFFVDEDDELEGVVQGVDPDRPAQPFTFAVVSPPSKGVLDRFDPASGAFLYRPNADRFGGDSFLVSVSDGLVEGEYQRVRIEIKGFPEDGDLLVTATDPGGDSSSSGDDIGGIYLVNPSNGDVSLFAKHEALGQSMLAMELDVRRGMIYVAGNVRMQTNEVPVLGKVDLATRTLQPLIMGPPLAFPIGLTFDSASGFLYVANGPGGILRVDPDTGASTVVTEATNLLQAVTAVRLEADGKMLVLDAVGLLDDDNSRVVRLDPVTGEQTLITRDHRPLDPTDFQILPDGRLLISGRGGLFELQTASSNLIELLPASSFSSLVKDMALYSTNELIMVDLFTKLVRYTINDQQLATIQTERPVIPSSMTIYREPASISEWRTAYFKAVEVADPAKEATVWGDLADPDQDAVPNVYEYAMGTHPLQSASKPRFSCSIVRTNNAAVAQIQLRVRHASHGVTCVPQVSTDLIQWTDGPELHDVDSEGDLFEGRTFRSTYPDSIGQTARFFRLKLSH